MPSLPPKKRPYWHKPSDRPPQAGRRFVNPWYNTRAWQALRAAVLRDNPLCVHCLEHGRTTAARIADHITPVSTGKTEEQRKALMWDITNVQGLCDSCHNIKSAKEKWDSGS